MIRLEFSETEIKALQQQKQAHPDRRVRRRMETRHLKALGYSHQEIGQIVGITQKTLRGYLRLYQAGGLEALKQRQFYQPQSALEPHRATLEAEFKARPAQSMKEATDRIEKLTNVRRSPDQVRRYLTGIGIKRLKSGQVPAKADPQAQADFLKKNLNRAWHKPNKSNVVSSWSMRPILSCTPSWDFYGVLPACSSKRPAVGNASMSWALWRPSPYNW